MNAKKDSFCLMALLVIIGLVSSCHKKNQQIDYNVGITAAQDYTRSQQLIDLVMNTYFKGITDSLVLADHLNRIDGATVKLFDEGADSLVILYPSWGGIDDYDNYRQGKIKAVADPGFFDSLAVIEFSFENFRFNNDSIVVHNLTLTNLGKTNGEDDAFRMTANGIWRYNYDTLWITEIKNVEWLFIRKKDPFSVYRLPEDYFLISGTLDSYFSSFESFGYSAVIPEESSVMSQFSCGWAKNGHVSLELSGVSYNSALQFQEPDSCDNIYRVDIGESKFYFPFQD